MSYFPCMLPNHACFQPCSPCSQCCHAHSPLLFSIFLGCVLCLHSLVTAHSSEGCTLETGQRETLFTSVTVLRMEDNSYSLKPQTFVFARLFRGIGYCCQPGYRLSLIFSEKVIKKFPLVPKRGHLIVRISFSLLSYPFVPIWLRLAHCAVLVVHRHGNESGIILLTFRICIICCEDWWEGQQDKS